MFSSGLSVNEFALLRTLGPRPLAQVMGASVVRTGWQYLPALEPGLLASVTVGYGSTQTLSQDRWGNAYGETSRSQIRSYLWATPVVCRLETISDAWNLARRQAFARLTEEATQVGADAVVGVTLQRADHDLGRRTVEYLVNGTAVHTPQPDAQPRAADPAPPPRPVLTDLSVQDYLKLTQAGQEPVGLVATTVSVFASPSRDTRIKRARTFRSNQELTELSQAFRLARETIRSELRGQIQSAGGAGVVGVELSQSIHREKLALASAIRSPEQQGWGRGRLGLPYYVSGRNEAERHGWVITMHAAGTAIRPAAGGGSRPTAMTETRLRL